MQIAINRKFIYKIRPEKMILFAIIFWVFCYIFSPVEPRESPSLISIIYIGLCLLFFSFGCLFVKHKRKLKNITIEVSNDILDKIYLVTYILGAIGVVFNYYDMFFLRDASLLFSDEGELEVSEGGNIFSLISGMLIFFTYVPVTLDILCPRLHKWPLKAISLITYIATALSAAITGSRFAIIIPFVYLIFLLLYTKKLSTSITKRNIAIFVFILLLVGYVVGGLFLKRIELQGRDSVDVTLDSDGYANKVPISKEYAKYMTENQDDFTYTFLFAYSNVVQYELHAIYEFPAVMEAIDKKGDYFYGQATFAVFVKFFYKLIKSDYNLIADLTNHNPKPGIWTTFFFQWYLDFWWFGVLLMFPMGFICKLLWRKLYMGGVLLLPLVLFVSIIWLLVLNLNQIAGSGSYALFSFSILPIIFRKSVKKTSKNNNNEVII